MASFNLEDNVKFYVDNQGDTLLACDLFGLDLSKLSVVYGKVICRDTYCDNLICVTSEDIKYDHFTLSHEDAEYLCGDSSRRLCVPTFMEYVGKKTLWINDDFLVLHILPPVIKIEGSTCISCHLFSDMSVPNQPDNTFKCYSCRENPLRKYF